MPTTPGKDAVIRYVEEATPGTTPADPDFLLFSRETLRAKVSIDVGQKESLDIGNPDVEQFFKTNTIYGVEVECHVYDEDRLLGFLTRNVDNSLKTYSLEYIPDASAATKHYYRARGWKLASWGLKGSVGEPYVLVLRFAAGVVDSPVTVDPGIGAGSREDRSTIADPIKHFASGAITNDGVAWAVLVNSFEVTVEQDVQTHHTTGQADPVAAVAASATRKISGAADISFDAGGATAWAAVKNHADHTVLVPFGSTGAGLLTLAGVKFPNLDVESNTDDDVLMGAQPFNAATATAGVVP